MTSVEPAVTETAEQPTRARPIRPGAWGVIGTRAPLVVHVASLGVAAVVLFSVTRDQWFVIDDWIEVEYRFLDQSLWWLLGPTAGTWTTLSRLWQHGMYAVFGFQSYTPYLLQVLALHVLAGHLLWRIMVRVGVWPWIATALALVFVLNGYAAQAFLLAFHIDYVGLLALGLVMILIADSSRRELARDIVLAILAVISLMIGGGSIALIAATGLVVLIRRGWQRAAVVVGPAVCVYGIWFFTELRENRPPEAAKLNDLPHLPLYVAKGLTATIDRGFLQWLPFESAITRRIALGLVFVLAGWIVLRLRLARGAAAPAFAMAAGALVYQTTVGLGRLSASTGYSAIPERYAYITLALLLPAVGLLVWDALRLVRNDLVRLTIVVLLGAMIVNSGADALVDAVDREDAREQALRRRMLSTAAVLNDGPYLPDVVVDEASAHAITTSHLRMMATDDALPSLPELTPERRPAASLRIRARFSRRQPRVPRRGSVLLEPAPGTSTLPSSPGCTTFQSNTGAPRIELIVPDRTVLAIRSAVDGELGVRLADGRTAAQQRTHVNADQRSFLDLAGIGRGLSLELPAGGSTEICVRPANRPA